MWKDGTSGPGLLVASRLVGVMGGKIWAESSPTQPGNIFHFTARFWDDKGSLSKPALTPIEELRGLPVLIVDENASNRRVLVETLRRWGMKPTAADGGEAALQILKEQNTTGATFELTMLDAEMPGMDGFAVARRLQDNLELAGATIMMHSAVIEGDLAVHCRQVGSDPPAQAHSASGVAGGASLLRESSPSPDGNAQKQRLVRKIPKRSLDRQNRLML